MDVDQRAIVARLEPRLNGARIDVFAPRHFDGVDTRTDRSADGREALAPLPVADDQHALAWKEHIDECCFHHSSAAASEQQWCIVGPEDRPQLSRDLGQYLAEFRSAVRDHRLGDRSPDARWHGGRSGKS